MAARLLAGAVVGGGALWGVLQAVRPRPAADVTYEARTFDRLPVMNARFMPDGQTIVYSAAARGYVPALYVISPTAEAPQRLDLPAAHVLAVSRRGELALVVNARYLAAASLYRHARAHDAWQRAPGHPRAGAGGRLGPRRRVNGDCARHRRRARSSRIPDRHGPSRGHRLSERPIGISPDGTRVAFIAPSLALRRPRHRDGGRPRRKRPDADAGVVVDRGSGLVARSAHHRVLGQCERRRPDAGDGGAGRWRRAASCRPQCAGPPHRARRGGGRPLARRARRPHERRPRARARRRRRTRAVVARVVWGAIALVGRPPAADGGRRPAQRAPLRRRPARHRRLPADPSRASAAPNACRPTAGGPPPSSPVRPRSCCTRPAPARRADSAAGGSIRSPRCSGSPTAQHVLVCGTEEGDCRGATAPTWPAPTFTPVTDEGVDAALAPDGTTLLLTT